MIRPARPEDVPHILAFWNPVIRDTVVTFNSEEKTEEGLRETIAAKEREGHGFLVAEDRGVLGFASYGQFRAGSGYARAMEHTIILSPEARGKGVGRALMAAIEDHARARGHHMMVAAVSGGNPAGVAFHAALGYRETGRMPEAGWKFGQYWELVLMQKLLS